MSHGINSVPLVFCDFCC
ncbi:CRISPR-associated DxTHG motif protein [Scytonema sp. UIC 10036]|nr:CRISPR-associated DxTHG motif protein [Scytonema sp. UIC 10036]